MLKEVFLRSALNYTNDTLMAERLWQEVEKAYTGTKRHYHNLSHLQNMYNELEQCKDFINDCDTVLFSLFYHDIVYKATGKHNEEKSADIAANRLGLIHFPLEKINRCREQILATKHHKKSIENDTDLLLDADMAVLGYKWQQYEAYYTGVRKEYDVYPDFLYNPGRAKVLKQFLAESKIYNTTSFNDKYEKSARENIATEIGFLI